MVFPGKARSGFAGSWVKRKVGAVLRFYQKLNRAGIQAFADDSDRRQDSLSDPVLCFADRLRMYSYTISKC